MIVRCLVLLALLAPPASAQMLRHGGEAPPPPPATGTPVGRGSVAADRLGRGAANWRSMAAMAAAAYQVLLARHQEDAAEEADPLFRAALAAEPAGPAVDAAIRLGAA